MSNRSTALVRHGVGLSVLLGLSFAAASPGFEPLAYRPQALEVDGARQTVRLPVGYVLEVLTERLEGPRMLTFGAAGELFIGSKSGRIYRLQPPYGRAEVLIRLPKYPHSVALRAGELLIAQTDGVYRVPYRPAQGRLDKRALSLLAPLPAGGGHSSRTLKRGPEGRIYVGLGISGNCSDEYLDRRDRFAERRGGILVLSEQGDEVRWQTFASGLRNPVGFDWHPQTGVLYACNNGPDHWGYEQPPEYFSRLEPGSFHGMPWFQYDGKRVRRDRCIERDPPRPIEDVVPPVATFPARSAPLGMAFVPEGALDPRFTGDAVVALHGSWATRPAGRFVGDRATRRLPKVVVVRFRDGEAQRIDDLVTGFQLPDGRRWARPAGVAIGPEGALYFTSDEGANALFRLRWRNGRP